MLAACPLCIGLRIGSVACKTFPEFDELLGELVIVQIAEALADHHDDIPTSQMILGMAEGFADLAPQPVALHGELDALLADDHAQARMIEAIGAGQKQNVLAGYLAGR